MSMSAMRKLGLLMLAVGTVLVALSPRRRALVAQKLAQSRRFVSGRLVDREARDSRDSEARDRWDDDGGARKERSDTAIR